MAQLLCLRLLKRKVKCFDLILWSHTRVRRYFRFGCGVGRPKESCIGWGPDPSGRRGNFFWGGGGGLSPCNAAFRKLYFVTCRLLSRLNCIDLWWTVSGQVKAHVVLTCANGVSPNHLPLIVASDRLWTTLSTRARWHNLKADWIYSTN